MFDAVADLLAAELNWVALAKGPAVAPNLNLAITRKDQCETLRPCDESDVTGSANH